MFDLLLKALASVASFLFPLFASYKALKTADPTQLAPWLMYWVVLACALLVESWTGWLLVWVPFYHTFRLLFLLYLVLPQTQGARYLYQTHLHPWLAQHEAHIDEFIGTAHDRLRTESAAYLRQAVAYVRVHVLGMAPGEAATAAAHANPPSASSAPATTPSTYTQSLLARFNLPVGGVGTAPTTGSDVYNLLATAVSALGSATSTAAGGAVSAWNASSSSTSSPSVPSVADRATFLAAQRDRLRGLLNVLDREAAQLEAEGAAGASSTTGGGLSKSRSEVDFEQIDAESGTEDDNPGHVRRRRTATGGSTSGGSWMPWAWGSGGTTDTSDTAGAAKASGSAKQ